jgi:hypothetical protein
MSYCKCLAPVIVILLLTVLFTGLVTVPAAAQGATGQSADLQNAVTGTPPTHAAITSEAMNVAVPFVANRGQTDDRVAYYATTFSGTVYVTSDGITHSIQDRDARTLVLTEQFVDAHGTPLTLHPQGEDPSATVVSSFIGNDPAQWQANLPTFTTVSLGEPYPGITVTLRATGSSVETLFTVAPGANVADVHVRVLGADSLTTDAAGQLVIASSGFENVSISTPHAFQDTDVASHYTVTGNRSPSTRASVIPPTSEGAAMMKAMLLRLTAAATPTSPERLTPPTFPLQARSKQPMAVAPAMRSSRS